jgi:DNA-binding response OmpR family regulator
VMKTQHLNIILVCDNSTRSGNMASRVRYQGHKVELVSGGFQTLHEIENAKDRIDLLLILGDQVEEMGCLEVILNLRVIKNPTELFVIHVTDSPDEVLNSLQAGSNIVLTDNNFNKINEAINTAIKTLK